MWENIQADTVKLNRFLKSKERVLSHRNAHHQLGFGGAQSANESGS
jgi:hypothetical protein